MTRRITTVFALASIAVCLAAAAAPARAQTIQRQDPRPYAPIAITLPDTLDQLYRDSATIKIGRVRVNQAGYRPNDDKFFYYVGRSGFSGGGFTLVDANTGAQAATGTLTSKNTNVEGRFNIRASNSAALVSGGDTRYTMQSELVSGPLYEGKVEHTAPGRYRIRVGADTSAPFWIHEDVYSWVHAAAIKFPGVNRCGNSESWFHGACHLLDATPGGWHDCGDHLKESITQSFLHSMLALASAALRDHDADNYGRNHNHTVLTDGIPDVLYEAKHGSDYIIRAYNNAGGDITKMVTAVGGFGPDHQWWGQPEYHDRMSFERGGPPREARVELGANVMGNFAAGLALTAKNYARFDQKYADTSIAIAKKMYEYGKQNRDKFTQTPAYSGNAKVYNKMAFAALGLAYATGERKYLVDLCYDKTLGAKAQADAANHHALFEGGWFTHDDPVFSKHTANTDWASPDMAVKWGFFRLILKDRQMCAALGIDSSERVKLIGKTVYNMIFDVTQTSGNGAGSIDLPNTGLWNRPTLGYDDIWKSMNIQMAWMWNRYQFGNIFDLYCYSDIAKYVQDSLVSRGIILPYAQWGGGAVHDWKAAETRQLMIRQMDYMLGVNPWDVSMVYGVGAKNHNHPHHRAANPEGKNVPGAFYGYRPPAGALHAGVNPLDANSVIYQKPEHYDDYFVTETGIDASAVMIIPVMGLAKEDPVTQPPTATIRTVYVGVDHAIIEVRQSRFGMTTIRYAENGVAVFTPVKADSNGVFHTIILTGLKAGTKYNFDALVADMFGNSDVIKDRDGEYFTFKTLTSPPGKAEITNVKICRVTADSAEIFWYTPNGAYDSKVVYGTGKPPATVQDGNIYGRPSQFHYVKIGGLKEKTTYYFYVENNGTRDDNGGQFYTFTTPVMHVEFDVRALKYSDQFFGFNVVNQDIKDYDSLELRIYVRAPDTVNTPNGRFAFADHIGFRVDIGIKYRSDGYQDAHFKTDVDRFVQAARPIKIDDTFNPADNTWGYYIPIPLGPAKMESGARFRLDLMIDTRSHWPPFQDLMNVSPTAEILTMMWSNAWSFVPHSRANGDPADYPGIPMGQKDDVDNIYYRTPINPYITVYRKNEFVWGYSPSAKEQLEKKTHYEMVSQITSPLHNPSEEYLFIEQVMPSVTVNGWAKVTENGVINDIWVNGNKVRDVASVAQYNAAADRWNLTIPVPVKNGGNNVDVTIFGGPSADCATCYGCAFSNHSFYLEFRGAEPYPSSMKLLTQPSEQGPVVGDSAVIGATKFYIFVDDMNGSLNKDRRDTVWVSVVNPVLGDSIAIPLIETGVSTGKFMSAVTVNVIDANAGSRGQYDILMDGGQVIWVTYIDPTDPTDISQAQLASRADFAVPVAAWFKDSQGVGSIDRIHIRYSKTPDRLPDSLHLTIPTVPGETEIRVVKAPQDAITGAAAVVQFALSPPIEGVTGFRVGEQMTARSFLVYNGSVKMGVITVQDSAGPALLDRALLYEKAGGGNDTLQVMLSEPMQAAGITGATLVHRSGEPENDRALTVVSVIDSSSLTNSLTLIVSSARPPILEGDSVYINPAPVGSAHAKDRAGNKAPGRPVPVVLKTAAPRIASAFYTDVNADGKIDMVELTLSKPLDLMGLKLWLAWENGQFVPVEWSKLSINDAETVVRADIDGLLMGDSIVTGGRMRVMATHNRLPGDTLRANVADKAAPVIRWAQFCPALEGARDTLNITFSETMPAVASSRPFKFLSGDDGTVYEMVMERNLTQKAAPTQSFLVSVIENADGYPGVNDSVRISTETIVYDTSSNIQDNAGNRMVKLQIKPPPLAIQVITAPNPFTPGAKSGGQPIRITARPTSKAMTELNIKGTVSVFDKLGNLAFTDAMKRDPGSADLIYDWNGQNKKGRKAGTGAYLVVVSVEHVLEPWEEKVKPVTAKALIYLKR